MTGDLNTTLVYLLITTAAEDNFALPSSQFTLKAKHLFSLKNENNKKFRMSSATNFA